MCVDFSDPIEQPFDADVYLAERFKEDVCLDCGHGAGGHSATIDRYGEPRVRCDADDEDDPLTVRAYNRRWMLGYLG
jgi:hypothetical protein